MGYKGYMGRKFQFQTNSKSQTIKIRYELALFIKIFIQPEKEQTGIFSKGIS
jgi:hypothetical protein